MTIHANAGPLRGGQPVPHGKAVGGGGRVPITTGGREGVDGPGSLGIPSGPWHSPPMTSLYLYWRAYWCHLFGRLCTACCLGFLVHRRVLASLYVGGISCVQGVLRRSAHRRSGLPGSTPSTEHKCALLVICKFLWSCPCQLTCPAIDNAVIDAVVPRGRWYLVGVTLPLRRSLPPDLVRSLAKQHRLVTSCVTIGHGAR